MKILLHHCELCDELMTEEYLEVSIAGEKFYFCDSECRNDFFDDNSILKRACDNIAEV